MKKLLIGGNIALLFLTSCGTFRPSISVSFTRPDSAALVSHLDSTVTVNLDRCSRPELEIISRYYAQRLAECVSK